MEKIYQIYDCNLEPIQAKIDKLNKNRVELELHHLRPRFFDGKNDRTNLIPLCPQCHKKVHKKLDLLFKQIQSRIYFLILQIQDKFDANFKNQINQISSEQLTRLYISKFNDDFFADLFVSLRDENESSQAKVFSKYFIESEGLM